MAEKYKVTFPLFAKVSLAGEHMAPLYQFLTDKQASADHRRPHPLELHQIPGRSGRQSGERFEPDVTPDSPELAAAIEKALRGEKDKHENDRASAGSSGYRCDILRYPTGHVAAGAAAARTVEMRKLLLTLSALFLLAASLSAAGNPPSFTLGWSVYVGWDPYQYMAKSGICSRNGRTSTASRSRCSVSITRRRWMLSSPRISTPAR